MGGQSPISHRELVALLLDLAGAGRVTFVEWPAEKKAIDIGNFYADSSKFNAAVGWEPKVSLREGFERTIAFYREHLARYLNPVPEDLAGIL